MPRPHLDKSIDAIEKLRAAAAQAADRNHGCCKRLGAIECARSNLEGRLPALSGCPPYMVRYYIDLGEIVVPLNHLHTLPRRGAAEGLHRSCLVVDVRSGLSGDDLCCDRRATGSASSILVPAATRDI